MSTKGTKIKPKSSSVPQEGKKFLGREEVNMVSDQYEDPCMSIRMVQLYDK
jgi:hypothetical protein